MGRAKNRVGHSQADINQRNNWTIVVVVVVLCALKKFFLFFFVTAFRIIALSWLEKSEMRIGIVINDCATLIFR